MKGFNAGADAKSGADSNALFNAPIQDVAHAESAALSSGRLRPTVPLPPGGSTDAVTRLVAAELFGLSAPDKTPPHIVERMQQATVKAPADPELRKKLGKRWALSPRATVRRSLPLSLMRKYAGGTRPPRAPAPIWFDGLVDGP